MKPQQQRWDQEPGAPNETSATSLDTAQDIPSLLQAWRLSRGVTDRMNGRWKETPFPRACLGKCFLIASYPVLNLQRGD